ncbi:LPS assembly lipoprotein LptE [Saprospiraceae bacterium]|nr:LPS assembly lipoprotein LptE [Saprospiraceae bacterium]
MKQFIGFLFLVALIQSCYSFKGISIPDNISTYNIPYIEITTADAPPSINTDLQEKLIQKINRESRLTINNAKPDITFVASIGSYSVRSIGVNAQNSVDANQLEISVRVEYSDSKSEENNWKQTFSQLRQFPTGTDLLSVQDQLVDEIFDDIVEDIFNKAFTNW